MYCTPHAFPTSLHPHLPTLHLISVLFCFLSARKSVQERERKKKRKQEMDLTHYSLSYFAVLIFFRFLSPYRKSFCNVSFLPCFFSASFLPSHLISLSFSHSLPSYLSLPSLIQTNLSFTLPFTPRPLALTPEIAHLPLN